MCWKCKTNIEKPEIITRSSDCPVCGASLRCCKNCIYFDVGSHYDCHETVDELVKDKEAANFCDYFKAKIIFSSDTNTSQADKISKARDAFAALFGD
jgi:hypothetical protein